MPRWSHGTARDARGTAPDPGARRGRPDPGSAFAVGREVDGLETRRGGQARDPATLRDRLAVDLLDVARENAPRPPAHGRADRVGVDRRPGFLEVADPLRGETARDGNADGGEIGLVERGANLGNQLAWDPSPFPRGVEPDPIQPVTERVGHPESLLGLVLEGVDEDD